MFLSASGTLTILHFALTKASVMRKMIFWEKSQCHIIKWRTPPMGRWMCYRLEGPRIWAAQQWVSARSSWTPEESNCWGILPLSTSSFGRVPKQQKASMEQAFPGLNHVSAKGIPKSAGHHRGRAHGSSKAILFKTSFWIEGRLALSEMRLLTIIDSMILFWLLSPFIRVLCVVTYLAT